MVNKKKYPRQIILNLTEKQYQQLVEKSKKNGMSYSEFLRTQIEYAPKNIGSMQELLKKMIYEIHKLGVNVNQIAHGVNMDFFSAKDKTEFFAYVEKFNRDKNEVVKILGG